MRLDEVIQRICELAEEKGANSTKFISANNIIVSDWVRQKCEYGCKGYATHFTCPPYSPTPEETRTRLASYNNAILLEFIGLKEKPEQQKIHNIMFELEKEAYLSGFYKAFAYTTGPCRTCEPCWATKVEKPNKFSKRECKNQKKARPAMEACGIDVFQTVRKAGYDIDVVRKEGECFKNFTLLLLD
ncbi:MAG: DUF2284 domain-containing protein [Nanoarchaeota archaeon]|nr:DUF2284 domain-containing protein [Nanoarchaeota archaeon]MBU1321088.1 DUF2284 domain-containing protein [Nanoarchaeota archaeon]MBU1596951.1 DUF2284 domain-containing protein [Nanoarchaeota archaeon]MBU2441250.1 DUF2284 domain-containing protein [Nanoarchaeota archaeon]